MRREPRADGARAPGVQLGGELPEPNPNARKSQPVSLPRRVFRKIALEPVPGGWRARMVGFDGRFLGCAPSPVYSTHHMAMEAAKTMSRQTGLPIITIETLTDPGGPEAA